MGKDIYGTVTNASGEAVSGANVEAENSDSSTVVASTTTNSDGEWTLVLETRGSYKLTATKSGESSLTVNVEGGVDQD